MIKAKSDLQKRDNVKRIFLIVLLAIVADQAVESVLLETIAPIQVSYGNITNTFLLATMPFALILATWSDFHCRRKTMIFALISLSFSALIIPFYKEVNNVWIVYASLAFKGIGGNVTPVALASLATIVPSKKFTLYLAIAICAYSLGLWVPIYLHSFYYLPVIAALLACIGTIVVIKWFKESEFDDFKFQNNTASLRKFFKFFGKDVLSIVLFAVGATVMLALFSFLASEVSYYQILLRGEVLGDSPFYSDLSLKMGISYYIGTYFLYLFLKKNISVSRILIVGILSALISILFSSILSSIGVRNWWVFDILFSFFSIGFALLTPTLFSILSKSRKKDEQGKIYGFLDTFDTLAAYIGVKYIVLTKNISFNNVLWLSFIIIFVSAVFVFAFIRDIQEREEISHK